MLLKTISLHEVANTELQEANGDLNQILEELKKELGESIDIDEDLMEDDEVPADVVKDDEVKDDKKEWGLEKNTSTVKGSINDWY